MCGIIGAFDPKRTLTKEQFQSLRDEMIYRGPDDAGLYHDESHGVWLGHRRLSIQDLSPRGHQPMSIASGAQRLWLTFNGEIYNFKTLREELKWHGHVFFSDSDSEVILAGYQQWGEEVVHRLQGMFAFVIWDPTRQILFLARDRVGIKPLYYRLHDGGLFFSSELGPMTHTPYFKKDLDATSLMDALCFGYISAPKTIWKDVKKLPAGYKATYSLQTKAWKESAYWDFDFRPAEPGRQLVSLDEIEDLLQKTVREHRISDVPAGAFLSGGIDSSLIVSMMSSQLTQPLHTFSIGFGGSPDVEQDELPLTHLLSKKYKTHHLWKVVDLARADERFEKIADYFSEPFSDSSSIPMDDVSQLTHGHVKVVLTGDGGDELFGGYRRYLKLHAMEWTRGLQPILRWIGRSPREEDFWKSQKSFLQENSLKTSRSYASAAAKMTTAGLRRLLHPDCLKQVGDYDPMDRVIQLFEKGVERGFDFWGCMRYVDSKSWLCDDVLTKVDRVTMRHSIEARVPFLDHVFIEKVQHLSQQELVGSRFYPQLKKILKKIASKYLPEEHLRQKKKGFGLPIRQWFRDSSSGPMAEVGKTSSSLFQAGEVQKLLNLHRSGKRSFDEALWTLRVVEHWWKRNF